jgi:hypothetical protein
MAQSGCAVSMLQNALEALNVGLGDSVSIAQTDGSIGITGLRAVIVPWLG